MKNSNSDKIEKALKYIFGEIHFVKLKCFFEQFYKETKFDFVIFTTRRCHILFCIFDRYFFSGFNRKNITFISDKSLHFYNNELKNRNCAIVDDILIHGRALKCVYERVYDKKPNIIETFVFMQSEDALHPAKHCVEDLVAKQTWKQFSNKIVSAIIISSFPYTSYIYSSYNELDYCKYNKLILTLKKCFPNHLKTGLSLNEVDNKNYINELLEKYIECYIFDLSKFSDIYGLEFSCLRVYYNKYLDYCIVTPYCLTNPMTENDIDEILVHYFDYSSKIVNVEKYETKYRAITTLYSYAVFYFLNDNYSLDFLSWPNNHDYIDMSYFDSFFSEIEFYLSRYKLIAINKNSIMDCFTINNYIAHKSNCEDILDNDVYTDVFINCIKNTEQKDEFYDTLNKDDILSKWFYNFLTKVNISEEKYFSNTIPEKQLGLSFKTVSDSIKNNHDFFEEKNITKFEFFSKLISCADSGFLSVFSDYCFYNICGQAIKVFSNFLITGEHVCRLYQNKYIVFILELLEMYEEFIKNFKSKYSKDEMFNEFFIGIKEIGTHNVIINNLKSAYQYIMESSNIDFIKDSIYEDINEENLYKLIDIGSIIIEESIDM